MIKRVNPFIILGALLVILLFLVLSVQNRKVAIHDENRDLATYESKAKSLKDLKNTWNAKKTVSQLNTIVSSPPIKKKSNIKPSGNKATLTINNLNKNELDLILKKLLNEPLEIKKINVNRVSDKGINLTVEVNK